MLYRFRAAGSHAHTRAVFAWHAPVDACRTSAETWLRSCVRMLARGRCALRKPVGTVECSTRQRTRVGCGSEVNKISKLLPVSACAVQYKSHLTWAKCAWLVVIVSCYWSWLSQMIYCLIRLAKYVSTLESHAVLLSNTV